jgi:REP element-mobilizing transposase RayT
MDFHINNIPFCCAYCSKFIRAFESCLEFMGCNVCRIAICPNCIIENIPEMSLSYISRYLDLQTIQTYFADGKPLFTGFGNHDKIIKKVVEILKTEPYVLWFQFDSRSPKQTLYKMANGQPIRTFYTI